MFSYKSLAIAIAGCFATASLAAETPAPDKLIEQEVGQAHVILVSPVVVTATRQEQNSFDLPVSIDVVNAEQIQEGQLQVNISESLIRIPGIVT